MGFTGRKAGIIHAYGLLHVERNYIIFFLQVLIFISLILVESRLSAQINMYIVRYSQNIHQ